MRFERFDRAIVAREFCFCQGCVDLVVANLVQQDRGAAFAAFQLGDQMVQALACISGNGPAAQGAYGCLGRYGLILLAPRGMSLSVSGKMARGA